MKNTLARWLDSDLGYSFRTSPMAMVAAAIAFICVFCSVFAGWVAPHDPFDLTTLVLSDARLPPALLAEQEHRIRDGHCNALPDAQIRPMTRIQIARDRAMADTLAAARQPGRTVLLIAGNGHVQRGLGVPAHLPSGMQTKVLSAQAESAQAAPENAANSTQDTGADLRWPTPPVPPRDHCAAFRPPGAAAR